MLTLSEVYNATGEEQFSFMCLSISSDIVLIPPQKARGIFMTDMEKKAFQEEEGEEEVRRWLSK